MEYLTLVQVLLFYVIYLEYLHQKMIYLEKMLNDHPGNRRLGELGIGMNPKIKNYIKDILFDEKIMGTVHLALGRAYEEERGGGKNQGTIHWDMIKDLRHKGSLLTVDGKAIIADGKVLV